jgi:hypothetical protein
MTMNISATSCGVFVMPAFAGIHLVDSGFRRNDDASIGVLDPKIKIWTKVQINAGNISPRDKSRSYAKIEMNQTNCL